MLLRDWHVWLVKNVTFSCDKFIDFWKSSSFLPGKEWFWCTKLFLLSLITKIFYLNPRNADAVVNNNEKLLFKIVVRLLPLSRLCMTLIVITRLFGEISRLLQSFSPLKPRPFLQFSAVMRSDPIPFHQKLTDRNTLHFFLFISSALNCHIELAAMVLMYNNAVGYKRNISAMSQ